MNLTNKFIKPDKIETGVIEPYYIKGKGIFIPLMNKILAMKDSKAMNFYDAVKEGIPTLREWHLIYYFKDKINKLLEENNGEPLKEKSLYWSSNEKDKVWGWGMFLYDGASGLRYRDFTSYVRKLYV